MSLLFAYYSSLFNNIFFICLFFVHLLFSIYSGMRFRLALWLVCILDKFFAFRMKVNMPKAHYHHFCGQYFFCVALLLMCNQFICLNILRENFEQIKTDYHGMAYVLCMSSELAVRYIIADTRRVVRLKNASLFSRF